MGLDHRTEALGSKIAKRGGSYVLTTGTGSGKSLSYFIPIINDVLRRRANGAAKGITAIVVYPMNALANSQLEELQRFLRLGYAKGAEPVRFARYTIQGFEAMLWLRKGFGFAGAWTVREQNRLLALCFGLPQVNKV